MGCTRRKGGRRTEYNISQIEMSGLFKVHSVAWLKLFNGDIGIQR